MTSAPSDSYRQLCSEDPRVPGISLVKATFLWMLNGSAEIASDRVR